MKYKDGQLLGVEPTPEDAEAKRVREANASYVADINFTSCHSSMSPAERIKGYRRAATLFGPRTATAYLVA